jgi:hypothetical protein
MSLHRAPSGASSSHAHADAHADIDRSIYAAAQTLASIVNDPRMAQSSGGFFGFGGSSEAPEVPPLPPIDATKYPPISRKDFAQYLAVVSGNYERFVRDRASLEVYGDPNSAPAGGSGFGEHSAQRGGAKARARRRRRRGDGGTAR